MNFRYFQHLYENIRFDQIKVIGKDMYKNGNWYHILGMTLKEKQASLYVLELTDRFCEEEHIFHEERTPRKSLKHTMEQQGKESFFLRLRELQGDGNVWQIGGGQSGPLRNGDYGEAYFIFLAMVEAGWKLSEDSPFYDADWDSFAVTNVELQGEYEALPEWTEAMQALVHTEQRGGLIEQTILLECGKTKETVFFMEDGTKAHCYINKVFVFDMRKEQEKKFADPEYREKILQHVSEEEFEEMKKHFFETLEEQCPKGRCYIGLYYECDQEVALHFYDKEYLDCVPESKNGSATSMFITVRPEEKTGMHGLPLRGAVIQKPVPKDTVSLEAELFSYSMKMEQKIEKLS